MLAGSTVVFRVESGHKGKEQMLGNNDLSRCNKRLKLAELHFAATNVKADLAKAGRLMPTSSVIGATSTIIEGSGIDFRKHTKILRASEISSPFIIKRQSCSVYQNEIEIPWDDLISATRNHYQEVVSSNRKDTIGDQETDSSHDESSFASTDSDTQTLKINNVCPSLSKSSSNKMDKTINSPSLHIEMFSRPCITMENSLGLSNEPRLLTLSSHPFAIIHVNAEFTRFTGLPSSKVLGKPLAAIASAESQRLIDTSFSVFSMKAVRDIVVEIRTIFEEEHNEDSVETCINCLLKTTLVSSESVKNVSSASNDVSHFSVEVTPIDIVRSYRRRNTTNKDNQINGQNATSTVSRRSLIVG